MIRFSPAAILLLLLSALPTSAEEQPKPIKILFLGDNGHHQPRQRFAQLQPVLEKRGIHLTYTDFLGNLSAKGLKDFDGLMIYANITEISPDEEKDLLDF